MAGLAVLALLLAAALVAWLAPRPFDGWRRTLESVLRRPWPARRWVPALALAALLGQAATALVVGVPKPQLHDEFSYLLAADTFVHGRLTNPTHPLWRHFETFHVLVQPTYASKYPPAQGLALALGQRLGHPVLGVWLTGTAFVAAAAWMLLAWLPPPWARLGALLVTFTLVVASPWSDGYSRGFVAAAGGALALGGAARLLRGVRAGDAAALAAGILVLAASRPWEGLVLTATTVGPVFVRAARDGPWRRALLIRALPTALLVLALGGGWLAYYQWRVTGSPWTMPYRLYDQRYASVPVFLWRPLRAVAPSPHPVIAAFFRDFEGAEWRRQHTLAGWLAAARGKSLLLASFYFGVPLALALAGLPWALRRRGPQWAIAVLLALLASQLVILPSHPHYVAPGACLAAYLAVESLRELRLWRRRGASGVGARLAAAVPLVVFLMLPVRLLALRHDPAEWHFHRAALERRLAALPNKQLVLVSYSAAHDARAEWVYDGADLTGTRVLWARAMTRAEDCQLIAHERGREAWLLEVVDDVSPPRLAPYPACAGAGTAMADPAPKTSRLPSIRQGSPSSRRSASG